MPEDYTTPDLVELTRRSLEAVNRRDIDTLVSLTVPDEPARRLAQARG